MPEDGREAARQHRWTDVVRRGGGPVGGLLVLVVLLAGLSPDFLNPENLLNVGVQASVTAVLAFGLTFVIISGGIDLSVGSLAGLAGVVTGWAATNAGMPLPLAVVAGLASGVLAGLVSGVLITVGRVPPFIATLAMLSIGRGLALVIAGGKPVLVDGWVADLGSGTVFGFLPYPVVVLVVFGVLTGFILRRTYAGHAMYAIGGNAEAARLSGIKVTRQRLLIYALSGLFASVAGILLAGRLASAQPEAGTGYELDAIAAVVIGGASLSGGVGSALGTVVGALILAVLRNGLNLLDISAFWQQVVIGLVIAAAVLFDTVRRGRRTWRGTSGVSWTPAMRRATAIVSIVGVVAAGWVWYDRQNNSDSRLTIALSVSTLNNPFFVDVRTGAQRAADRLGVNLQVRDAGEDSAEQADAMENAVAMDVDAVIVNPVDSDAVVPSIESANMSEIPVIAVDRAPSNGRVVTTVASDNVAGGKLAARHLAQLVGSGSIAVLEGQPGTSAARERSAGFDAEIRRHPRIRVVATQPADFDRAKALNVTENIIQAHPDVKGVFAANDEMALGAVKALGGKAGTAIHVVGFDGTPEGLAAVRTGAVSADVAQRPLVLGEVAVERAVRAVRNRDLGPGPMTHIPIQLVTKATVEEFMAGN